MHKSDEEIVKLVQKGENELFGILIERFEPKLLRYGRRFLYQYEDVEDSVQDVFLKAYTNIQGFNIKQKFSPWIYRIAHNTFINVIKKRGHEPLTFFDPDTILGSPSFDKNPEEEASSKESIKSMAETLYKLEPKYREPIVLYFFEEKDYKEIAEIMHIPTSTVGIRLRRGKEKLKKILQKNER